ncbi:MAG: helix-turn-helix transcriptional regulator [Clostridia bacterium]|nr:helix-turn-helix transcriptional regulator [Clostridia bacterium]
METKPKIRDLHICHKKTYLYLPPIVWKGDVVGHVGVNDTFFWVLEGECFLMIEDEGYVVRPGQLAFLPKGKKRTYTHISEPFVMYEMAFSAESEGENLMALLGLAEGEYVVDVAKGDEMRLLFENSHRVEMFKSPVYSLGATANLTNIIRLYTEARFTASEQDRAAFQATLAYMKNAVHRPVSNGELAAAAFMQPTYFIRRFKKTFGTSPQNYFGRLKLMKAMHLLASTALAVEEVAAQIGIADTSYFSRFFKKHCGVTPVEFRRAFRRMNENKNSEDENGKGQAV